MQTRKTAWILCQSNKNKTLLSFLIRTLGCHGEIFLLSLGLKVINL